MAIEPHAVVIPFGVPDEGRGLGLGLAALVHAFARVEGAGVAIAQLCSRGDGDQAGGTPASPLEAFVPPGAWRDIAERGDAPGSVSLVLTGSLEPPVQGAGAIRLLAFDGQSGAMRARVDSSLDGDRAGASLVAALEQLWSNLGGGIGAMGGLRDLEWEPLESVLRAERCALHDPARGGPHDRLAAMLHLGRAIGDAPAASYPCERLAALALDTARSPALDDKLTSAAARALERAVTDAPERVELVESLAALRLRQGRAHDAEVCLEAAIATAPRRARLYALLSQALRAQGGLDAALAAVRTGLERAGADSLLSTERGMVLAVRGDLAGAGDAWRDALARDPVQPAAFCSLATLAMGAHDTMTAQSLVDAALAHRRAVPDVLRRAVELALATEGEGMARAARVAALCERLLTASPADAAAALHLGKALVGLGDPEAACARFAEIERAAPRSPASAEAQIARFCIEDPEKAAELSSLERAALAAQPSDLPEVAVRARSFATLHGIWAAWVASALAERRLGRAAAARSMLLLALEAAPGAGAAHLEMAEALIALGDGQGALDHADKAIGAQGESPRTLSVLARALACAGLTERAREVVDRMLQAGPRDDDTRAALAAIHGPARPGPLGDTWATRVRCAWQRAWSRR